ncbi:MAG: M20/M25/M40 family metallo-hydrolase, partial [Candidatus Bathyarchaeia archaeon]
LIRDSCEVPREENIVKALQGAVKRVTGKDVDASGSRYVDDLPVIYKEAGIPTVCYGPLLLTDWLAHSDVESVSVKNLETVSRVYLALALNFCGLA